jgi:hypothetical protein
MGTDGANRDVGGAKNLMSDGAEQELLQVTPAVGSGQNAAHVQLPRQCGQALARIAFGHDEIAGNTAGLCLGRDALQGQFCLLFHFRDVEVGNGAGIERNCLAWRNDMGQCQRASAGTRLGYGMGDQILGIGKIGGYQNFFRHDKGAVVEDSPVEGFHRENLPAGESAALQFMWL